MRVRAPVPMVGVQGTSMGAEIVARAGEQVVSPEDGFVLYSWQDLSVMPVKLTGIDARPGDADTGPVDIVETDLKYPGGVIIRGASGMNHVIAGLASTEWGPVMSQYVTQAVQRFSIPLNPAYRAKSGLVSQPALMPIAPVKMGEPIGRVGTQEEILWRVQSDEFEEGTGVDPTEWLAEMRAKGVATSAPSGGPGILWIAAGLLWFSSRKRKRRS